MVLRRAVPTSLCLLVSLLLIGCGSGSPPPHSIPVINSQSSGSVHGGQQPVVGATIQLYTVGTTADGSGGLPLLDSTITSDSTGSFSITGRYTCPSAAPVYIVATGGNPGLSTANPNIALMAALGPCSSLTPSTFISINELTTVAAVTALAPYMLSVSAIGSSPSDAPSLAAAFNLANQLVNTTTGTAPGTNLPTGYTVPVAQLNTLADILSACINSTGGTAGDRSLCGQLFTLTTIGPNLVPTNTIQAMLYLASNPALNTSALYALTPPAPAFQPTLTSPPPDFTIRLTPPSGSNPILQISPSSLTFDATPANFISQPQTVTLTNSGATQVAINSIIASLSTSTGFSFAFTSGCGAFLLPGGSCTVSVTAETSQIMSASGFLYIYSSTPDSPQQVALSGTGIAPRHSTVTLTPNPLNFTIYGANEDITLTNTGNALLTIGRKTANSNDRPPTNGVHQYAITNDNCIAPLAPGASCTYAVSSLPTSPSDPPDGSYSNVTLSGQAGLVDDASTGFGNQSVSITDTYPAYLSQGSTITGTVSFPANQVGYTQTSSIQLANIASGSPAASLTLGGPNPGDFTVSAVEPSVSPNPSSSCPGGTATCTITVQFKPTAAGTRTAKLSLDANGTTTGQYIFLTGTGVGPGPSFTVSPNPTGMISYLPSNIDPNSVGKRAVTVTNTGTTTLSLAAAFTGTIASDLTADASQCHSLAPQATCVVNLTYLGTATGTYSAALFLYDSGSTASATVPLTGTTIYWATYTSLSATNSSYTFPSQQQKTNSAPVTFTITDQNNYSLGDPLTVSLINNTNGNFTLPGGSSCPASPQPCTLSLEFTPQTTGSLFADLEIIDNVTGEITILSIDGTATP